MQWWAFWYPGAEPGGGGYIAQRIFSARDERQGLFSVLWFNIAHYALRPWPWILTALAAIVLYPGLQHPETSYMMIVNDYVPHALRGIIVAGFLAAFMSTIATQLNWGTSYLVEDFYRRFLVRHASERHYVHISQLVTVLLVIAHRLRFRAARFHSFRLASRAASRRRHRQRLPAALVLVAHQCLERNFCDDHRARRHSRAALAATRRTHSSAARRFSPAPTR